MRYDLFGATLVLSFLLYLFAVSFCEEVFSDKTILLEVKKAVSDSSGILSSWDPNSLDHCSWFGVSCDSKSRVVSVNIVGCDDFPGKRVPTSSSLKLPRIRFLGVGRTCSRGRGKLVGELSPLIGELTELRVLSLPFNDLSGEIPEEIWGLEKLEVLDLEGNKLSARFPETASGLRNLRVLNLGSNRITAEIPLFLLNSANLEVLNLAGNLLKNPNPNLSKKLPKDLTPTQIGRNCRHLEHLQLSGNNIKSLDVSGDRFRGRDVFLIHIPKTLLKTRKLLAINDEDEVSQSNSYLNIDSESEKTHSPGNGLYPIEIASIASASIIVAVLIVLIVLFLYIRKWKQTSKVEVAENREIKVFLDIGVPLTYENIVRATGNFSNGHCIGHGGFGSTYKAQISQNILLAVKRLSVGRFQGVQQFNAEIMTLEMVRHPNLVTLIGYHASEMEMFLLYNYLPGGNLEDFIQQRSEKAVDWKIIHKISLDVARALAYLHDQCSPKVLHRDVKPSNILLDKNLNAYLSDFGLSKLLGTSQTHATTGVAGTFGYVAPEYAMTCRVSEKADVYSYGVVLLELVSDKKALDPSFSSHENGFNIVSWALMMLKRGQAKDVFTPGLWESGPHDDLVEVLHLALKCTVDSLSSRPTMKQVVQQLKQVRP